MVETLSRIEFVPFDGKIFGHVEGKREPKTSGLTDKDIETIHWHLEDFGLIEHGQGLPILSKPEFHDHLGNPSDAEYYLQGRIIKDNGNGVIQPVCYDIYISQGTKGCASSKHLHEGITEEHYVCIRGRAKVNFSGVTYELNENDSLFIPVGVKHQATIEEQNTTLLIIMVNPSEKIENSHHFR